LYTVTTDDQSQQQVDALPAEALAPFAEAGERGGRGESSAHCVPVDRRVREQHINGGGTITWQDAERKCMEAIASALEGDPSEYDSDTQPSESSAS
jgi:hypothetical protein